MKNFIAIVLFIVWIPVGVFAQKSLHLTVGTNLNMAHVKPFDYWGREKRGVGKSFYDAALGYNAGLVFQSPLHDRWGYGAQVEYCQLAYTIKGAFDFRQTFHYVGLGIIPRYELKPGLEASVGGQVLILANEVLDFTKPTNILANISLTKKVKKMSFGLSFSHSLMPFQEEPSFFKNEFYHRAFAFKIGYQLFQW